MQQIILEFKYVGTSMLTTLDAILMFCFFNFRPYLLRPSTLIHHDEEPNLSILSQIPLQILNSKLHEA